MNKRYHFFVEVITTDDSGNKSPILVSGVVEAEDVKSARDAAHEELLDIYTENDVWEVDECDMIEEEAA